MVGYTLATRLHTVMIISGEEGKKKSECSEIRNCLRVPYIQTKETRMVSGEACSFGYFP